ncbi:MAG: tetratricopeptide repeat protein [Acidobacteriota bacterium]|nr:tetratricopeptide repeat protein [Acidobacteriota bacterium]
MKVRTFFGILIGALLLVGAIHLAQLNAELLRSPVHLGADLSIPLYTLLLAIFLASFVPIATLLLIDSLRRDLALRSERRAARHDESLDRAFQRAVDYQTDHQWRRAAEELEAVLAERPQAFQVLLRYGEVLRQAGRVDEAVDQHLRASVLYPQSVAVFYRLAEDYEAQGQSQVAAEIRNRLLREFPGLGLRVLRRRRNEAMEAGRWQEAGELQERIEQLLGPLSPDLDAEEEVRLGLEYQRGVGCLEEDRYDEAAEIFEQLLDREPRFIPAAIMLGEARRFSEDPDGAMAVWSRGFRHTGSPVFLQRLEDFFIDRAEPARAIETLWSLIGDSRNELLPRFFLGRLYYRLEMHREALKVLDSVRERIGASPTFHFLLARIHQRLGELPSALEEHLTSARLSGLSTSEYRCSRCSASYAEWQDRCSRCGAWSSVELDFEEERLSAEELGVQPSPVWGGYHQEAPQDEEALSGEDTLL